MKALKRYAVFFGIGGTGYTLIELVWRGRTHWSMALAGGISFAAFSFISKRFSSAPLLLKAILGALTVTLIELIFGIVFNIRFKMGIWDYSALPFNLLGQICPIFSAIWCALALIFIPIAEKINEKMA